MKHIIFAIFFLLIFAIPCLSQSTIETDPIEKGWRGIKPLKTDKAFVSKILGTPKIDDNNYYGYSADEAFIQVNFSTAPCQANQYNRGKFNVSEDVVLDYSVNIKQTPLSEIKFNAEKYIRDASDHTNFALYINDEDGVGISVIIYGEKEFITDQPKKMQKSLSVKVKNDKRSH